MVDVLLSTYEGERYLPEFLASLRDQTVQDWRLHVHDDGSSDNSLSILDRAHMDDPRICAAARGPHVGPAAAYGRLLAADSVAGYTAFADQDDVWNADKLKVCLDAMFALEAEAGSNTPCLVHTDLMIVDDALKQVAPSYWSYANIDPAVTSFARLLAQNVVTGCATMINRAARTAIGGMHADAIMHDWWIALYVSAAGRIRQVAQPTVRYRQHTANALGAQAFDTMSIIRIIRQPAILHQRIERTRKQALSFADTFDGVLPEVTIATARAYGQSSTQRAWRRRAEIVRLGTWKQGVLRNIALLLYA